MEFETMKGNEYKLKGPYPPDSILWTTLPLVSWIIPAIGHTGITECANKLQWKSVRLRRIIHHRL
jgi:hypothetical protein